MPIDPRRPVRPERISPRLVVDDVHDQLLRLIIDGHMEAESPLSIDALAREFGVSSSPVREALARLESTGLVQRLALRGYRVAPALDAEELADLLAARLLLEPAVAAEAALSVERDALARQLETSVDALEAAPQGEQFESFRAYYEADREFHRAIVAGTGNRFLVHAYDALGSHVQRFRLFSGRGVTDAAETVAEHRAIAQAIADGDAPAAEEAMRRHLEGVRSRAISEVSASL
ncbi:GntR family transcriptional regulator [Microbacterium sp. W4I20]|uniref:GntR family transcriptional regulator n=1 Tax=Microbacterium sp. W4I20 TaxID=3042262 RepID=UPI002789C988|nr:GntR family transcriptional regulator [Microbacterium sp. W4I20]MDQ0728150.1 DNA-binding GntR family transcriptional regulator [Microbacterium sp. W4I20]